MKAAKHDKYTFGKTEIDIGSGNILFLAFKKHTTVNGLHALKSKRVYLLAELFFKPEEAGCSKKHIFYLS
jgi:hypothetical protein